MRGELLTFTAVAAMAVFVTPVLFEAKAAFHLDEGVWWRSATGMAVWLLASGTMVFVAVVLALKVVSARGWLYGGTGVIIYAMALTLVDEGIEWLGFRLGLAGPMLGVLAAAVAVRAASRERIRPSPLVVLGGALSIVWLAVTVWVYLFLANAAI